MGAWMDEMQKWSDFRLEIKIDEMTDELFCLLTGGASRTLRSHARNPIFESVPTICGMRVPLLPDRIALTMPERDPIPALAVAPWLVEPEPLTQEMLRAEIDRMAHTQIDPGSWYSDILHTIHETRPD